MAKTGRKPGTKKTGGKDFKPGISGNPNGRPKIPEEIKAIQRLNSDQVKGLIAKFARMTKQEMSEHLSSTETNMIEMMIGSIVTKAIQEGDQGRFNFLLDRSIGKVKEHVEVSVQPKIIYKTTMTNDGRLLQDIIQEEIAAEAFRGEEEGGEDGKGTGVQ